MSKIAVIGVNHAGTAAINTILDNYSGHEVVGIDSNSNISFLGCGMALWIGKQISGPEGLFYSSKEKLEEKGALIHIETKVNSIDFDNKVIYAEDKNGTKLEEKYDKLILATGSLPIVPKLKGIDLENVQLVKLYQNAQDVIHKLQHKELKNIVVVGAGYIGVELAEAFKRMDKNVTLIDLMETSLSSYYDDEFTSLMDKNLSEHGINLAFGEKVLEFQGDKNVEKVITDKGSYDADMVIMAIGFRPNNELGKNSLKLFKNGAYIVDKHQETSMKDVYAIGDCATVYDNASQDLNYIALATNAVRSAIIAGHNACGNPLESVGVQGSNAISIFGFNMVSTGLTLKRAKALNFNAVYTEYEDLQKPAFMEHNNEKVKLKIVYDKSTRIILGAQMASRADISMGIHMFSLAIQEKVTIDKLKLLDIFFLPHFNQPFNFITMAALKAE
ncbi:H2O-forming NADH oxidase [Clostridium polynesiense]|uniref:H2O-forming NADH oxidase n=1 Tax=Clostridium polynesiense TaxID=1325933 RepID=UPI000590D475|nr:FAD-dependent oxidoreductase [Clostridium polynesiense]